MRDILELRAFVDSLMKKLINNSRFRNRVLSAYLVISIYLVGVINQFLVHGFSKKMDAIGNSKGLNASMNPLRVFPRSLADPKFWSLYFLLSIIAVILFALFLKADNGERRDERGILVSSRGTYGTARIATFNDIRQDFYIGPIEGTKEPILGLINADPNYNPVYDTRPLPIDFDSYSEEEVANYWAYNGDRKLVVSYPINPTHENNFNHHKLVVGGSGSGKSFTKINTDILQIINAGESFVAVDPKGAVYSDTVNAAKKAGYRVKVFNINVDELTTSDSWSPLHEIDPNGSNLEPLAQQFAEVVISNTSDKEDFHSNNDKNLLTALALYVITSGETATVGEIYSLLSQDTESLTELFKSLPEKHPAKAAWNIFAKGSDNVVGNVMNSLGGRLQVFQSPLIKDITSTQDIDLSLPGREKCAYYVVLSDSDTSMRFLSSLFFAFLFTKLNAEAKEQSFITGKEKLQVPVNILLDEFPNIGKIPDFPAKLATVRSRGISITMVIQALGQLQEMYPGATWEPIVANCDEFTFLGATDIGTASYVSEKSGTMTIKTESGGVNDSMFGIGASKPKSRGEGQRPVFNAQEVTTKKRGLSYVFMSGRNVMVLMGMPYTSHPLAEGLTKDTISDRIPFYRTRPEFYKKHKITKNEQIVFASRLGLHIEDKYVSVRQSQRMAMTTADKEAYAHNEMLFAEKMYQADQDYHRLRKEGKVDERQSVFTVGLKSNDQIRQSVVDDYELERNEGIHEDENPVEQNNSGGGIFDFVYADEDAKDDTVDTVDVESVEIEDVLDADDGEDIFGGLFDDSDEIQYSSSEDEEDSASILDMFDFDNNDDDEDDDIPLYEMLS